jgi:uncharacterized protein YbdZ (MbtH family)
VGVVAWDKHGESGGGRVTASTGTGYAEDGQHAKALSEYAERADVQHAEWVDTFFSFPLAPQGDAPAGWTEVESSLSPESCMLCHPAQYADWKESWHADAMSPGTLGQLIDWDGHKDGLVEQCQTCHAPLAEQHPKAKTKGEAAADEHGHTATAYVENPIYDPDLRKKGVVCASCHVRAHQRFGPPSESAFPEGTALPHGGFTPVEAYQDSRFCYSCHDFKPNQKALNGKLLQETYEEWRRTSFAEQGTSCQDCHMPEGRHLWKGVHDADMVRAAIRFEYNVIDNGAETGQLRAGLKITNIGAGHRMPTYTTPQITLILEQVNAQGTAIEGTRVLGAVGRYIKPDLSKEYFDTRLMPEESHGVDYAQKRHPDAVSITGRVEVWPDEAYRRFYEIKLRRPENHPLGKEELEEALRLCVERQYTVWEEITRLPEG